jgi:predicted nucleic acid-binding protein
MKAVLDTNVWLDWLVFDDPSTLPLQAAADTGLLELPASAGTRDEWLDVIGRPQFGLDADARKAVAARYARLVTLVPVAPEGEEDTGPSPLAPPAVDHGTSSSRLVSGASDDGVQGKPPAPLPMRAPRTPALLCRDPDDQKFLELALATDARFLVTRDRALLDLARRAQEQHGLAILRPDAPAWIAALAECVRAARGPAHL